MLRAKSWYNSKKMVETTQVTMKEAKKLLAHKRSAIISIRKEAQHDIEVSF